MPPPAQARDAVYRTIADPTMTAAEKAAAIQAIKGLNDQARQIESAGGGLAAVPMGGAADTHLLAPAGTGLRPFAPGEYVQNPDGSWSSERSMTVQTPRLAGGKYTVIPSVYLRDGKPVEAGSEDEAVKLALESGKKWQPFPSLQKAEDYSIQRENEWQKFERPEDATVIAPLYQGPALPPDRRQTLMLASLRQPTAGPEIVR